MRSLYDKICITIFMHEPPKTHSICTNMYGMEEKARNMYINNVSLHEYRKTHESEFHKYIDSFNTKKSVFIRPPFLYYISLRRSSYLTNTMTKHTLIPLHNFIHKMPNSLSLFFTVFSSVVVTLSSLNFFDIESKSKNTQVCIKRVFFGLLCKSQSVSYFSLLLLLFLLVKFFFI